MRLESHPANMPALRSRTGQAMEASAVCQPRLQPNRRAAPKRHMPYRLMRRQAVACSSSSSRRKRARSTSAYSGWLAVAAAPLTAGLPAGRCPRCGGSTLLVVPPAIAAVSAAVGVAGLSLSAVGVAGLGSPSASMDREGWRASAASLPAAGLHEAWQYIASACSILHALLASTAACLPAALGATPAGHEFGEGAPACCLIRLGEERYGGSSGGGNSRGCG